MLTEIPLSIERLISDKSKLYTHRQSKHAFDDGAKWMLREVLSRSHYQSSVDHLLKSFDETPTKPEPYERP